MRPTLKVPPGFPQDIEVLVSDLDRTLVGDDFVLRPRTRAAIGVAREAGVRVLVVTGRVFTSVQPYLSEAGIDDPVVCCQGAAVADPTSGRVLRHEPIALELAREAIAAVDAEGFPVICYVEDELYVARETPDLGHYARNERLTLCAVGDLCSWLAEPPTKLVSVGEPERLDILGANMKRRFRGRLSISKSLPYFLEFTQAGVTKASGVAFLAEQLGFSAEQTLAFGDGENDVELLEWAGYGVAVAGAHASLLSVADWVCPPASEEGVAQVIDRVLSSRVHG